MALQHCSWIEGEVPPTSGGNGDSPESDGDSAFSGGTFDDIEVPEEMVLSILVAFFKFL